MTSPPHHASSPCVSCASSSSCAWRFSEGKEVVVEKSSFHSRCSGKPAHLKNLFQGTWACYSLFNAPCRGSQVQMITSMWRLRCTTGRSCTLSTAAVVHNRIVHNLKPRLGKLGHCRAQSNLATGFLRIPSGLKHVRREEPTAAFEGS